MERVTMKYVQYHLMNASYVCVCVRIWILEVEKLCRNKEIPFLLYEKSVETEGEREKKMQTKRRT